MIYNSYEEPALVKVLKFLQAHNTEYLSGQDLSDVLRISRVAVWKNIKKIQELGYTIESKKKRGYKLTSNSDKLLPWEITSGLKTKTIGQRAYYFDTIDSTQNQAIKLAQLNENDGAIIIAAKQTGGKGRLGRKWISPEGGIWLSVILHPKFDISIATLFPIASAVAIAKAIEKLFKISPKLKWPNDLTVKDKKIAGILVDATFESNKIENLVLGIGINFQIDVKKVEQSLKETGNYYGITSLNKISKGIKPVKLVQIFLLELEKMYEFLNSKQTNKIISEWTKRSSTIGKKIEIDTVDGKIKGKAIRIDEDGALVLARDESSKKFERVIAGDVTYLAK